jgi:hypothetical protein
MADNRADPNTNCTRFISTLGDEDTIFTQTEYSTSDMLKYNLYLLRLGADQGFALPSAALKAKSIAVMMQSYERGARRENTAVAIGVSRQTDHVQIMEGGPQSYIPRVPEPVKPKRSLLGFRRRE